MRERTARAEVKGGLCLEPLGASYLWKLSPKPNAAVLQTWKGRGSGGRLPVAAQ